MTSRDHVLQRLRLCTHPFAPDGARDGTAFATDPFAGALDPNADPRLFAYYFDLYDWNSSPVLRGLSSTGLRKFPTRDDLSEDGPLLVLVSGTGRSGRGSLVNLILHKIQAARGERPIVVPVKFNGSDHAQNVKQLAISFIFKYSSPDTKQPNPTRAELQALFNDQTKTTVVDGEAYYSSLFVGFSADVRAHCSRPIVFHITGGDRYDLWSCLYQSSAPLSDYLIVETPKVADAKTCYTLMRDKGHNVVHIDAAKLDGVKARDYIVARLEAERPSAAAAADSLLPFTDKAIEILFEVGSASQLPSSPGKAAASAKTPVTQAIGWLRKTLSRVLQEHIAELTAKVDAKGPAVLNDMGPDELLVTDKTIWAVRQQMNEGN
jgi:hypothetical protein